MYVTSQLRNAANTCYNHQYEISTLRGKLDSLLAEVPYAVAGPNGDQLTSALQQLRDTLGYLAARLEQTSLSLNSAATHIDEDAAFRP